MGATASYLSVNAYKTGGPGLTQRIQVKKLQFDHILWKYIQHCFIAFGGQFTVNYGLFVITPFMSHVTF